MTAPGGGPGPATSFDVAGSALPRGTVTLLFTDIEGSTRRWEVHGEAMAACVARHDQLLDSAIAEAGGCVVKGTGDGRMAVFANADHALTAAVEGQRALGVEDWGEVPALRVRMGLHTGWCEPLGADYFGPVVNRAARIADAGHGGQVLLSAATAAIVRPRSDLDLVERGSFRLKDLAEPIELVQLVAPGTEAELLPLRTLDLAAVDLPVQRTTFLGRTDELARAVRALESNRLLTLVGPGGVGKTRLAVQVAAEAASDFDDGVRFVDLTAGAAADGAAVRLADQLLVGGLVDRPAAAREPLELVLGAFASRELLLVLDNCEHVVEDAATVVDRILDACPRLRILATSREALRIPGEQAMPLAPFAPAEAAESVEHPAVGLFIDRAMAAGGSTDAIADIVRVARICNLVDGLPLGIELAAAHTGHLSLDEVAEMLDRQSRSLVARDRFVADRHRTLTGLLDWSYELLGAEEQAVLTRASVFAGPVGLDAIEAVCGGGPVGPGETFATVAALVDKSLLVHDPQAGAYGMINVVRTYAQQRLVELGESARWCRAHAEWGARLLDDLDRDTEHEELWERMRRHGVELHAALLWSIENHQRETAWRLAAAMWRWFEMTGRAREGRDLLTRVIDLGATEPDISWGRTLDGAANLAMATGDTSEAQDLHRQAIAVFSELGDRASTAWARIGLAMSLLLGGQPGAADEAATALDAFAALDDRRGLGHASVSLGVVAARSGDPAAAEQHYLRALATLRLTPHRRDTASVLSNLGNLAQDRGEMLRAMRFFDGAMQLYQQIGDRRGAGLILNNMCLVAQARGDNARAVGLATQALAAFSEVGDLEGCSAAHHNLANLAAERGDRAEAVAEYREAIEGFRAARDPRGVVMGLGNLAAVAWRLGAHAVAWQAEIDRAQVLVRLGLETGTRSALASLASRAGRIGLDELATRLSTAADTGLVSEIESLLAEARLMGPEADAEPDEPAAGSDPRAGDLTARERELLVLVGQGQNNAEIAAELFISRRTVDAHLSHIRRKLGITDRAKLVVFARDLDGA